MLFKFFNLFFLLTFVSSRIIIDEYKSNTRYILEENEDLYNYKGWSNTIINRINKRIDNRNIL